MLVPKSSGDPEICLQVPVEKGVWVSQTFTRRGWQRVCYGKW